MFFSLISSIFCSTPTSETRLISQHTTTYSAVVPEQALDVNTVTTALNTWYEYHDSFKISSEKKRKAIQVCSGIASLLGSSVLLDLAYNFGQKEIGHGLTVAVLTSPSPILGFYRVNEKYIERWVRAASEPKSDIVFHNNKLEKTLRTLFTLGNGVAVVPYLYAAHQASDKIFGSLPVSIIFDLATLWSNVLVYDMSSEWAIQNMNRKVNTTQKQKEICDYLEQLKTWYVQLNDSDKLDRISTAVSSSSSDAATDEENFVPIIQNVDNTSTRDTISTTLFRNISNTEIDRRLVQLLTPSEFVYTANQAPSTLKTNLERVGGVFAFLASYYLAVAGRDGTYNYLRPSICEPVDKHNILLPTTCSSLSPFNITTNSTDLNPAIITSYSHEALIFLVTSLFSCYTTFSTISYFFNLFAHQKTYTGTNQGNSNLFIPVMVTFCALMRTIPNLDLAVQFLGSDWYWIALSACTGLSIFAGSMWALNLFCDAKFQTPVQKLRANLVGKTDRILQAIPQMAEPAINALHQIIKPGSSVA